MTEYEEFLETKRIVAEPVGFDVGELNPMLYDFQRDVTRWALKRGRGAIWLDCGLGKSFIQSEWAHNVAEEHGERVLIAAPLQVAPQTIREAAKMGIEIEYVRKPSTARIQITNYEMLDNFIGEPYCGMVLDEASILKSIDGATKEKLLASFTDIPYRLTCTATPCPNDISELGNQCEFLGVMKRTNMLASFFVHDEDGYRLRGHAAKPFYRWLASWALAMKSPADLGYDASRFVLPPLEIIDEVVSTSWRKPGELFPGRLKGITDRADVRKSSVPDRVARAAQIARECEGQFIVACGLNAESEACAAAIPDAVEMTGSDSFEVKNEIIMRFLRGEIRGVITKSKMICHGLNLQNAHTMICVGMSDSYEMYYQLIRREWRYGQTQAVRVHVVVTDHEVEIVDNVRRKEREAEALSREIIDAAKEYEMEELGKLSQKGMEAFEGKHEIAFPSWLNGSV